MKTSLRLITYCICLWFIGFFCFILLLPHYVKDSKTWTDMIVVYTGGYKRIEVGFQLLKEEKASRLLISGVNDQSYLNDIMAREQKQKKDNIILGYNADNTHENALETRYYVRQHQIKSLRLVTSFYHMPRSLLETKYFVPNLKIIPHPVFWGEKPLIPFYSKIYYLFSEYNKYIIVFFRILLKKAL